MGWSILGGIQFSSTFWNFRVRRLLSFVEQKLVQNFSWVTFIWFYKLDEVFPLFIVHRGDFILKAVDGILLVFHHPVLLLIFIWLVPAMHLPLVLFMLSDEFFQEILLWSSHIYLRSWLDSLVPIFLGRPKWSDNFPVILYLYSIIQWVID